MCVLHCLWDREDPWGIVRQFRDAVPPGSYLALSHMTGEAHSEAADALFRMTQDLHWNTPLISRSRADIERFFDGFTLVEPGLVSPAQWRPDLGHPLRERPQDDGDDEPVLKPIALELPGSDPGAAWHLCGIGRKNKSCTFRPRPPPDAQSPGIWSVANALTCEQAKSSQTRITRCANSATRTWRAQHAAWTSQPHLPIPVTPGRWAGPATPIHLTSNCPENHAAWMPRPDRRPGSPNIYCV